MKKETKLQRNQRLLETGAIGVIRQGRASVDDQGGCLLRGPGGCKCFLGQNIPDDRFKKKYEENSTVEELRDLFPGFFHKDVDIDLMKIGQAAHDDAVNDEEFLEDFMIQLRETVPKKYSLKRIEAEYRKHKARRAT